MAKVLVLYHSYYGHIEAMAQAVAAGAREVAGTEVTLKRVPETVPAEAYAKSGGKADQAAAVATPGELSDYDAIVFGTPTRFGNMSGQMRTFLDQTDGGQGERMPSAQELGMAGFQGRHVAAIAAKLFG